MPKLASYGSKKNGATEVDNAKAKNQSEVAVLIRLMQENEVILRNISDEARSLVGKTKDLRQRIRPLWELTDKDPLVVQASLLHDKFLRLRPPAEALARRTSQMIEHAKLDDIDRIELRLRLATFEGELLAAKHWVQGPGE